MTLADVVKVPVYLSLAVIIGALAAAVVASLWSREAPEPAGTSAPLR